MVCCFWWFSSIKTLAFLPPANVVDSIKILGDKAKNLLCLFLLLLNGLAFLDAEGTPLPFQFFRVNEIDFHAVFEQSVGSQCFSQWEPSAEQEASYHFVILSFSVLNISKWQNTEYLWIAQGHRGAPGFGSLVPPCRCHASKRGLDSWRLAILKLSSIQQHRATRRSIEHLGSGSAAITLLGNIISTDLHILSAVTQ